MNIKNNIISKNNLSQRENKETTQYQKNQIIILTISTPSLVRRKPGFKNSIASSFITDDFSFNPDEFLQRMNYLKLNKFKLFCVSKTDINNEDLYPRNVNSMVILKFFNIKEFFNFDNLFNIFYNESESSFEHIFLFRGFE